MTNVVRLHSPSDVDRLWEEYAVLARALVKDAKLCTDIDHMQQMARAHARWSRAFLALENAR